MNCHKRETDVDQGQNAKGDLIHENQSSSALETTALTPEEVSARAGDVVTLPIEQWRSMQQQLEEMERRQRELLAALGSVTDNSNK